MDQIGAFIDHNPLILIAACWLWVGGAIAASVLMRRAKGRSIFARTPKDALFVERRASGSSHRNLLTRLGGAKNALFVAVPPEQILIHPHFPFSLMFLPEIYGLDYEISRSRLRKVEEATGLLGFGRKLIVEFTHPSRGEERFELRLRETDRFLEAVAKMRKGAGR